MDVNQPLLGRNACVIGGTGGIGRAVSLQLAEAGAHVTCHGRSFRRVADTVDAIETRGGSASGFAYEIPVDSRGLTELAKRIEKDRSIDILVVSFGPVFYGTLSETPAEEWHRVVLHNLALPGILLSGVLPRMVETGWGRIVLFGGTGTDKPRGFRTLGAYSAAKTGITSLVRSAALETAGTGVAVGAVIPRIVDTEYLSDSDRERLKALMPEGRLDKPEETAKLVLQFICGDDDKVNGTLYF